MDEKTPSKGEVEVDGTEPENAEPVNNLTPDLKDAIRSIDAIGEDGSNPGVEDDAK